MIHVSGLTKTVRSGGRTLTILDDLALDVEPGEIVAVRGPSGSGKSTLLGLLAGLDQPDSGTVRIAGEDLAGMEEEALAAFRSRHIGFVFQSFHLLPNLTARENVSVPLEIAGAPDADRRAGELLEAFGIADRGHHLPSRMSGGEQQRTAIARAVACEPALVLADEPTGNLDEETGARISDMLLDLRERQGTTILMATHDPELAARADHRLGLRAGRLHPLSEGIPEIGDLRTEAEPELVAAG